MAIDSQWSPPAVAVGQDLPFKLVGGVASSCAIGALVCDLVYWRWPDFKWVTFSVWLIAVGLLIALLAVVVGLVDRIMHRRVRQLLVLWPYLAGFAATAVVSILNAFVHSRDAYAAVVPDGLALSILAVGLLVVTPIAARAHVHSLSRTVPR